MVNILTINEKLLLVVHNLHAGPGHIRLIASETGLNHVTVMNQLNSLEKMGIVAHTTKGRNKEYHLTKSKLSKSYIKIAEEYTKLK